MRVTRYFKDVRAGCFECFGSMAKWTSKNAQGVAARHHDLTGHKTWVEIEIGVNYGDDPGEQQQEKDQC